MPFYLPSHPLVIIEKNYSWDIKYYIIAIINERQKVKNFAKIIYLTEFNFIANTFIKDIKQSNDRKIHYCYNFLANAYFKAFVYNLTRNIVCHEIKNLGINVDIKFLVKNVIPKNIKKFVLNNIDKLLYKIAKFIKFLIKTIANIVASSSNIYYVFLD